MVVVMSDRFVGHVLDESEPGTGVIWLDNVVCGDSCVADLSQCSYEGWGFSRCGHETDVSIACHDDTPDSGKPHYTICRNFHGLFCLCVCVCLSPVRCAGRSLSLVPRKVGVEETCLRSSTLWSLKVPYQWKSFYDFNVLKINYTPQTISVFAVCRWHDADSRCCGGRDRHHSGNCRCHDHRLCRPQAHEVIIIIDLYQSVMGN